METSLHQYHLDKPVWSDADFNEMTWHDCHIHSVSFGNSFELLFDIDYIFRWVSVGDEFRFWVAPCTLVFENVYDISFESTESVLDINEIRRIDPGKPKNADYIKKDVEYTWLIDLHSGEFSFRSTGFKQYVRQEPILQDQQYLIAEDRGGGSFKKSTITK